MTKLTIVFFSVLIGFYVWAIVSQMQSYNTFNTWSSKCITDGGILSITEYHLFSQQYECFKDGKIIDHVK